MPIDASIYSDVKIPQRPDPLKTVQIASQIEDIKSQAAQRQALTENTLAMAQKRIQDAKTQAAANQALQEAGGDLRAASKAVLPVDAQASQMLSDKADANDKSAAEALGMNLKNTDAKMEAASRLAELATPDTWNTIGPAMAKLVPEGITPPAQFDQAWLDRLNGATDEGRKHTAVMNEALKLYTDGKPREAYATALQAAGDDPAARAAVDQAMPFVPKEIKAQFANVPAAQIPDLITTPEQKATMANAAAIRAQAASNAAETARHNRVTEADAAQRIGLSGGTGGDPEAIAGWVRQLRNPSSGVVIGQVPMALRTAVIKALQPGEVTKLSQQSQAMKDMAQSTLPSIQRVQGLAKQINDLGLMGSVAGRWRQLVAREASASDLAGLTPAQKQLVGQFVTESGLLISGIARAHGGARGGGSIQMIDQLKPMLDPANKDLDTYIGNLAGATDFMNTYAHMGEEAPTTAAPAASAATVKVSRDAKGNLVVTR